MSRQTIPYRELPVRDRRFENAVRRVGQVLGWALALSGLALVCAAFSR
jgi:hypothetical protein